MGCKVLVVDDDKDSGELIKRNLEELETCKVEFESDVTRAESRIHDEEFDCIVSDFDMGEKTGLELFNSVSETDTPFILFTGKGSEKIASKAISKGITDYIRKGGPEQYERLVNRVSKALSRKNAQYELRRQKQKLEAKNKVLEEFHQVTTLDAEFDEKIRRLLDIGLEYFGLDTGILSRIEGEDYHIEAIEGSDIDVEVGDVLSLKNTFCQSIVKKNGPVYFNREHSDEIEDHPAYEKQELEVYLGVPVFIDNDLYGTLNFSGFEAVDRDLEKEARNVVQLMAEWIGKEISRRRSRDQAEANQRRLRQIIDNLPQLVFAKDESGEFLLANTSVAEAYGTTVDKLEGSTDDEFADSEEEAEKFREDDREVIKAGETKRIPEESLTTANGQEKILETTKIPYNPVDSDGMAVLGVSHDITEKKERTEKLQLQSSAMEATMDGIAITDTEGHYIYMNEAHAQMFGRSPEYFEGQKWTSLYPEEEVERIENEILPVLDDEGQWMGETIGVHSDGSQIIQEITLTVMDDGKLICTNRDITEEKQSKRELEEKNRRLDEFNSIVSHDLRNPLNVALGYLDLSRESMDDSDLEKVENSLNRMRNIIDELLAVSGDSENFVKEPLHVEEVLEEAIKFRDEEVNYEIKNNIKLKASRTGLTNIFDNLISNSLKHNDQEVQVFIGEIDSGFYYEDTGSLDADIDEIRNHGFTTSEHGRGLGISIVERLAEANNWEVELIKNEKGALRIEFITD